jgi:hypothetical protein
MTPSIGRIVIATGDGAKAYVTEDEKVYECPAIITRVVSEEPAVVNLTLFVDGGMARPLLGARLFATEAEALARLEQERAEKTDGSPCTVAFWPPRV